MGNEISRSSELASWLNAVATIRERAKNEPLEFIQKSMLNRAEVLESAARRCFEQRKTTRVEFMNFLKGLKPEMNILSAVMNIPRIAKVCGRICSPIDLPQRIQDKVQPMVVSEFHDEIQQTQLSRSCVKHKWASNRKSQFAVCTKCGCIGNKPDIPTLALGQVQRQVL